MTMTGREPISVLIIDDSIFIRKVLQDVLEQDPEIKVIGTATNGLEGMQKILQLRPQVVTMDVQMPVMDGLQTLEQLMTKRPTPVIILSSITTEGAHETLRAFDLGAFDVVVKPKSVLQNFKEFSQDITSKVKAAAEANLSRTFRKPYTNLVNQEYPNKANINQEVRQTVANKKRVELVVIGISTGGPPALQTVLPQLPADLPVPVIIIQHMPPGFTGPLAQRLDTKCQLSVKEAADGEPLVPGIIYVAPAGYQTIINKRVNRLYLTVTKDIPTTPRFWPSADITLSSVAEAKITGCLSVIMTGMGNDGLEGVKKIKAMGGLSLAQSEETCVVYGMPRAVVEAKMADLIVPLEDIAKTIAECVKGR